MGHALRHLHWLVLLLACLPQSVVSLPSLPTAEAVLTYQASVACTGVPLEPEEQQIAPDESTGEPDLMTAQVSWGSAVSWPLALAVALALGLAVYAGYGRRRLQEATENQQRQQNRIEEQEEEIHEQTRQLQHVHQYLARLAHIGQLVQAKLTLEEIIHCLHRELAEFIPSDLFAIGLINPDRGEISFHAGDLSADTMAQVTHRVDELHLPGVHALMQEKVLILNNYPEAYRQQISDQTPPQMAEFPKAALYVPLVQQGVPFGVIALHSFTRANQYTQNHAHLLQSLGINVVSAINHARYHEQAAETQKELNADLLYTQRFQQSLHSDLTILGDLVSDFALLFRPLQLVSGDFYWCTHTQDRYLLVVADSTGQGVPGAFLSMIGQTLLQEIIIQQGIVGPAEILEHLDAELIRVLSQENETYEGSIDLAVLSIPQPAHEIVFAGAGRPLWYIQNKELLQVEGDPHSVGVRRERPPFQQHRISWQAGNSLFLFSDGLTEQLGGEAGTPFLPQRLKDQLWHIQHLTLTEQKEYLEEAIDRWMQEGNTTQTDDISWLGLRL
ncbi:MAG TPA: hypothetical protein DCP28_15770 [Cytophagales bacterium]|nr:hypothetical protein [Cytophagales bacterium]